MLLDAQLILELALNARGELYADEPVEAINGGMIVIGGFSVRFGVVVRVGVIEGDEEDDMEENDERRNNCFAALAADASFATPKAYQIS